MSTSNPFAAITKTMMHEVGKLSSDQAQGAAKQMMDGLRDWGDLVQSQAQAIQTATLETVEEIKSVKEPLAAMEAVKSHAKRSIALTAKHLQETTALSIEQFNTCVDLLQERHPTPDAFSPLAQGMKRAASTIESGLVAAMNASVEATGTAPAAKKLRSR